VAVLVVVVIAGVSRGGGGHDAQATTTPPGTSIAGPTVTDAGDDNPGAVDGSLTVPPTTGGGVTIDSSVPVSKTVITKTLSMGMVGDNVKALQQRLTDLGFAPGGVDGSFGTNTRIAVWAYEKLVLDTPSDKATGRVTPAMWSTMQDPITITPRRPSGVGTTHMEIYLPQQVAIVFTDDKPKLITHISSGTGETWCDEITEDTDDKGLPLDPPVTKHVCGVSKTPGGVFKFYRRYTGDRQGPLGGMWNPVYFNYGIAVHGAANVPLKPASHGCIRIPMFIADYFPSLVTNGDRVYVWDGVKEPEQHTKAEMTPPFNYPDPAHPDTTTTSSTTSTTTTTTVAPTTTTTVPKTTTTVAASTTTATTAPVTTAP
jgi:hypothetical protein